MLGDDVTLPHLGDTQFAALVFAREIAHTADVRWPTAAGSLDPILPHALTTVRTAGTRSVLADLEALFAEGAVALVTLGRGSFHARIAAREQALVGDIETWLRETFPVLEPSERRELPVRFWTCGPHGAGSMSRMIDVPSFEAIEQNYPETVRGGCACPCQPCAPAIRAATAVVRTAGNREDVRPPCTRLGMASLVRAALCRRS